MTILELVTAPDPRLEICSQEVKSVTPEIQQFMDDMVETMYAEEGLGLSAVQVGRHIRVLVMDMKDDGEKNPIYMVNPEIESSSEEESLFEEGCLSFPGQRAMVTRPKDVTVRYLDYHGKSQKMECTGLLATCVQHEMDHLNGVVFIDHVSRLKREMILRKVTKIKKQKT
jgi:peptide deformylase